LAGCGGDDSHGLTAARTTTRPAATSPDQAATSTPETTPRKSTGPGGTTAPSTSPESQQGGAGDEEPARSLALLTGRGGRITPRVVRVPAYISIRVEVRSADGGTYSLQFGDRVLSAGGDVSSVSGSFPGLRPGKALVGRSPDGTTQVRIEATAKPGP
jgi:hypothetical protein